MSRSLPSQRNFEDIRKEARELLHDLRRLDAAALRRHCSLDCEAGRFPARLADAQYIVAREYGYRSWQKLKQCLEANLQHKSTSSPERSGEGARGRGSQTRDPAVDHVAGSDRVQRVLSSWTEAAEEQ